MAAKIDDISHTCKGRVLPHPAEDGFWGGSCRTRSQTGFSALTENRPLGEAAEKVECFFSPENLIIEMIPDFVLFGIIFSILARLFLSKCAF